MKKKSIAWILSIILLLCLAGCSGQEKSSETTQKEEKTVKLVTNGRLSAIEPPKGWELEDASTENQLTYNCLEAAPEDGSYKVQLWIDIYDFDTPEELLETMENSAKEMGKTYQIKEQKIGEDDFHYFVPDFGYATLYGTKNGVSICISHDLELSLEDAAVLEIINSIQVEAEEK